MTGPNAFPSPQGAPDGAAARRKVSSYIALIPVCLGVFIAADDQTVVVTVLPRMMVDLGVQVTELDHASWSITGYLLGYLAAMPLIGRLSDAWGHRRMFILSMLLFMAGSAAVALSGSLDWLIAMRVVQAVGAGALVPVSIAIAGDLFPSGQRAIPYGIIGASAEAGGVIGPLWGGLIIDRLDWQWVFWINLPLAALTLALLVMLLAPSPHREARIDFLGGALLTVSLSALTLALSLIPDVDAWMVGLFAVSAASLAAFIARQRGFPEPLLPLSLFATRAFSASNAVHMLVGAALIIGMVTVPLMANTVMALTPLEGGLWLMRMTAAIAVGGVLGGLAGRWLDWRLPAVTGLVLSAAGYYLMSGWDTTIADPQLTAHLALAGLGFGLLIAPIALAATETVGEDRRGVASATVTSMRIVGMTLGLAALAAWGSDRFFNLTGSLRLPLAIPGETPAETLQRQMEFDAQLKAAGVSLFQDFFLIAMALCLLAVIPALWMSTANARRAGRRSS
ncbi:MAG: MFS transporter [SAR202 cluster bacterium]|nr:MFS transporter [SAR202 cluster bacterium]